MLFWQRDSNYLYLKCSRNSFKMIVKQFFITNNNQITINFGTWTNDSASVNPLQPGDA